MKNKIIMLVGPPGSGKSSYAKEIIANSEDYFIIINQDKMGSREKCLTLARKYLNHDLNLIIDRTNINKKQRAYWIKLAKEFKAELKCIEFKAETEACVKRIKARKHHETIPHTTSETKVREIVNKFMKDYEAPNALLEGFNSHITFYVDNIIASERKDKGNSDSRNRYWSFIVSRLNKITCGFKELFR